MNRLFVCCMFVAGMAIGYCVKSVEIAHEYIQCNDYSSKTGLWRGYVAYKEHEVRCFWVESEYPWRVRQGLHDVR